MSLVAHKVEGIALSHLFGVVSGSFQPVFACCGLLLLVSFFTNENFKNFLTGEFTKNKLHVRFYDKVG